MREWNETLAFEAFRDKCVSVYGSRTTEDGAIICPECWEPVYADDFPEHGWLICPICEFNPDEDQYEDAWDEEHDLWDTDVEWDSDEEEE